MLRNVFPSLAQNDARYGGLPDALVPVTRDRSLTEMSLADAPDYLTAVAAGIAHDLTPSAALKAAFGKWATDHADAVQEFGLANFYDGKDVARAMVNYTRLTQYLAVMVSEQGRQIEELREQNVELQRLVTTQHELIGA